MDGSGGGNSGRLDLGGDGTRGGITGPLGKQNRSSAVRWVSGPSSAVRTTLERYNPLVAVSAEAYGFDEDEHQDSFLGLEMASEG